MKRSRLGPGKRSIDRGSTFAQRISQLRRAAPADPHLAALERRLALLFHDSVQHRRCPICHEAADYLHAHHCIEAAFLDNDPELRALATPERMIGIRWDLRNALGACAVCHGGHHGPSLWSRITRGHIPASAWEFAAELDALVGRDQRFTVRLERMYPDEVKEIA